MFTISLVKFRRKPTKEALGMGTDAARELEKEGVKVLGWYWTLGRYDAVVVAEAPDATAVSLAMKTAIRLSDAASIETLVGMKREEAIKLVD